MLIFGSPSYRFLHLVELLLVRCSSASLHEAILYKIYMVYQDFITLLIFGVLSSTITPISTFSGAFVSNACLRLFVVVLQDLHCLQRSYHNVDHYCITLYHHTNFHI